MTDQAPKRMRRYCSLATAIGARHRQEDRARAKVFVGVTIAVLSDGMGGCRDGDVAAATAVNAAWRVLHRSARRLVTAKPHAAIATVWRAIAAASSAVYQLGSGPRSPGATLIIGVIWRDRALFASLGDSSAYVDGRKITRGHNTGHILFSSIGTMEMVEIHIVELGRDATVMLTSDGLDERRAPMGAVPASGVVLNQLLAEQKHQDNITVFVSAYQPPAYAPVAGEVTIGEVPIVTVTRTPSASPPDDASGSDDNKAESLFALTVGASHD